MTNHPRQNWMNHCSKIWLRPTLSSMATAHKAKKPIIHFRCERSREICVCFVVLLVTPIDLYTHALRPFDSFLQSFDTWYSDKRLADRFTGFTVNASHQGQSILQSSILAYWTLSGIDPGTKSTTSTTTGYQFFSGIGISAVGLTPPPQIALPGKPLLLQDSENLDGQPPSPWIGGWDVRGSQIRFQ